MRAVRCDVCGAKAMIAAAKCPTCGHLFELRDGFGELLPLAYCSGCASYYPESVGSCKWCGTKPERAPIDPRIWRGAGVALVGLIGVVWLLRNGSAHDTPQAQTKPLPAASAALDTDSTTARLVAATTDSLASLPIVMADTAARDTVARAPATKAAVPASVPPKMEASPIASTSAKSVAAVSPPARRSPRWVRTVSRHWVVVRANASRDSRIVASIGPKSRVELGESRGEWRRIRTKGIAGWVEPRSSFELAAAR